MVCFIFVCFLWVLVGMVLDIYLNLKIFFLKIELLLLLIRKFIKK